MSTITKKELIDRIAERTQAKRVTVKSVIQAFLDEITRELDFGIQGDEYFLCPLSRVRVEARPVWPGSRHGDVSPGICLAGHPGVAPGTRGGHAIMIGNVSAKYALRSLWRHPRRTILSMVGAGVGCAIGIIATAWVGGSADMQLRAISESGAGHLRIVPPGWLLTKENNLRLTDGESTLEQVESVSGIRMTVPRARANGLLAFGNRTRGVQIVGVQPKAERESNRLVYKSRLTGRYLEPGDKGATVIGGTLAKRLDVELDDDLYVTLSGKDGMTSAMFRIVGILRTGSRDLDASICHVTLTDLARVTGHKGVGEISIKGDILTTEEELKEGFELR